MKASINQILGWTGSEWVYAPFPWTDDLETAKATMVSVTNAQASDHLQPSDWVVVRQSENGTPVPKDWKDWRQLIRDEAHEKVLTIEGCTSKEELNEYCQGDGYRTWADPPFVTRLDISNGHQNR